MDKATLCYCTPNLHKLVHQVPLCGWILACNNNNVIIMITPIIMVIIILVCIVGLHVVVSIATLAANLYS